MRSRSGLDRPDIQIISVSVHHACATLVSRLSPAALCLCADGSDQRAASQVLRGWVRIASADPLAAPKFCFNMLTERGRHRLFSRWCARVEISRERIAAQAPSRDLIAGSCIPGLRPARRMRKIVLICGRTLSIAIIRWGLVAWGRPAC